MVSRSTIIAQFEQSGHSDRGRRELILGREEYRAPVEFVEPTTEARALDQLGQSDARVGVAEIAAGAVSRGLQRAPERASAALALLELDAIACPTTIRFVPSLEVTASGKLAHLKA